MTAKQLPFAQEARAEILKGVNVLANAVRETLGPRGAQRADRAGGQVADLVLLGGGVVRFRQAVVFDNCIVPEANSLL